MFLSILRRQSPSGHHGQSPCRIVNVLWFLTEKHLFLLQKFLDELNRKKRSSICSNLRKKRRWWVGVTSIHVHTVPLALSIVIPFHQITFFHLLCQLQSTSIHFNPYRFFSLILSMFIHFHSFPSNYIFFHPFTTILSTSNHFHHLSFISINFIHVHSLSFISIQLQFSSIHFHPFHPFHPHPSISIDLMPLQLLVYHFTHDLGFENCKNVCLETEYSLFCLFKNGSSN